MIQRCSGYERKAGDAYWTPKWVYDVLYSVEPIFIGAVDPAPRESGGFDWLKCDTPCKFIATNPPYSKAEAFCRHALDLAVAVAMLLPMTFDAAKTRRDLFRSPFKAKYTLVDRIRWENLEQKKNGPSSNHAWYVWDKAYEGPPVMGWLTKQEPTS